MFSTDSLPVLPAGPRPITRPPAPLRRNQLVESQVGSTFITPAKRRARKNTQIIEITGHDTKRRRAREQYKALLRRPAADRVPDSSSLPQQEPVIADSQIPPSHPRPHTPETFPYDNPSPDFAPTTLHGTPSSLPSKRAAVRPIREDAHMLLERWTSLLPLLIMPYIDYISRTTALPAIHATEQGCISVCKSKRCVQKSHNILCLYWDSYKTLIIRSCSCEMLPQVLVRNGLFPASPTEPRVCFSIELLNFYAALFEKSSDAVVAFAAALKTFHNRRGFFMVNDKGQPFRDPFRRGFSTASRWFDNLRTSISRSVDDAIRTASLTIQQHRSQQDNRSQEPAWALRSRCPACFGGAVFGKSFNSGGNIHVCCDGNFHHRHRRSAGDTPSSSDTVLFIPKEDVDQVGHHINHLRPRRMPRKDTLPALNSAVDECQRAYTAADGNKVKTNGEVFDDTGLMALVCRHDIPILFANIDTPGEQQKYAVALIIQLFSLLPENATVTILYDVGCVLARSINLYDILPESIVGRLQWATSAMHAYGHQWVCQIVYNPRLKLGMGLTDGEGVERLWSRLRKLIGITRMSARSRRIQLLDTQAMALSLELRHDLGQWIRRRFNSVQKLEKELREELRQYNKPDATLREQWQLQRDAQMSLRSHAPARLTKELETVLGLQTELEIVQSALDTTQAVLTKADSSPDISETLEDLQRTHARLQRKVDGLYTSLNVQESMPLIKGVTMDILRILLLARDLKINIRRRAINMFFEWERLDQATGGREAALGTKLHQQTHAAISKRRPALTASIRKFNSYIDQLATLYNPSWGLPLPAQLSTKLADLREDPNLMEDVWLVPLGSPSPPLWLDDTVTRKGIRALLKYDRCIEERRRIGNEADHLSRWFGNQLAAVELAIRSSENSIYYSFLTMERNNLLRLQLEWHNPLVSDVRFDAAHRYALETVETIIGYLRHPNYVWLPLQLSMDVRSATTFDGSIMDIEDSSSDSDCTLGAPGPDDSDCDDLIAFDSDSE